MQKKNKTEKRLTASVFIIALLSICLCITTAALALSAVSVENNVFTTAKVKINLNDEKPVIKEGEFLFEPGMTVKKDFFIQNLSTCEVYYKLYFKNVSGDLASLLNIKICDGDKTLFSGNAQSLSRAEVSAADDILAINEKRDLQIYFHLPKDAGNEAQSKFLTFDFAADAVQVKNNADKVF